MRCKEPEPLTSAVEDDVEPLVLLEVVVELVVEPVVEFGVEPVVESVFEGELSAVEFGVFVELDLSLIHI